MFFTGTVHRYSGPLFKIYTNFLKKSIWPWSTISTKRLNYKIMKVGYRRTMEVKFCVFHFYFYCFLSAVLQNGCQFSNVTEWRTTSNLLCVINSETKGPPPPHVRTASQHVITSRVVVEFGRVPGRNFGRKELHTSAMLITCCTSIGGDILKQWEASHTTRPSSYAWSNQRTRNLW